jgi:hypothetical protein
MRLLERFEKKLTPPTIIEDDNAYHSLSPVRDADDVKEYIEALDWAIKRREDKDILNIALTGPYGSGKSSILKTFIETRKNQDLHFLPISLATFKEDASTTAGAGTPNISGTTDKSAGKEGLLRQIELSILQQIFYYEEDNKIPDSRFKKIRSLSRKQLIGNSLRIIVLGLSVIGLFFLKSLFAQLDITASGKLISVVKWVSLFFLVVGACMIIYKSIRTITSVSISKLKLQSAEIELGKDISKSALNNHLDEILYFFDVTRYNVVIIEDLDRFEQTEIFTKLREINQLINNSKKIKRKVVFVYAVKDEMFQDKDRTKFFDFIIPVIPVINSSNSSEKLKKIVSQYNYQIRESLIDDISLFIDDMRLLYNVMNEFRIYQMKLGAGLVQEKLLAMVVYKNINPKDFVDLGNRSGFLYSVFQSRKEHISAHVTTIDEKINQLDLKLAAISQLKIKDVRELRMLYVLHIMARLREPTGFRLDGAVVSVLQLLEDDNFRQLMAGKVQFHGTYNGWAPISVPFREVEKEVDSKWSYLQREDQIVQWSNEQGEAIKQLVAKAEGEKLSARHLKVKDLIIGGAVPVEKNTALGQLTAIMLRNGYIDEDYQDYISIFYPESITREDRQFLLDVKQDSAPNFEQKLSKVHNLLPKLRYTDFQTTSILNFDLVDFLLKHRTNPEELGELFRMLKSESPTCVKFIDAFIERSENVAEFTRLLMHHWPGFWDFVQLRSNYPRERVRHYCKLVIEHCEVTQIKKIADATQLQSYIERDDNFLSIVSEENKLVNIILALNLHFQAIDISKAPEALVDLVYTSNHYALNAPMIATILRKYGINPEKDNHKHHYTTILQSGGALLIDYVKDNLDQYLTQVYSELPELQDEPEDTFLEILNQETLSTDMKMIFVDKTTTLATDIDKVVEPLWVVTLMGKSRFVPTWQNVLRFFSKTDNLLTQPLTEFLNKTENAKALSLTPIVNVRDDLRKTALEPFERSILESNDLDDDNYIQLLESLSGSYNSLEFEELSEKKVKGLLARKLLALTSENYSALSRVFPRLTTTFLFQHIDRLVLEISNLPISAGELVPLLTIDEISIADKLQLINGYHRGKLQESNQLKIAIGRFLLKEKAAQRSIDAEILKMVLLAAWNDPQRISLFASTAHVLPWQTVEEFLNSLNSPYPHLNRHQLLFLEKTDTTVELVGALAKIGYVKVEKKQTKELEIMRLPPPGSES